MALVFCRSCKAKITQRDTTCPRCGAPTSRLVPIVTGIIVSAVAVVLYSAVKATLQEDDIASVRSSTVALPDSGVEETDSRAGRVLRRDSAESDQEDVVRTVLSDE